MVTNEHGYLDRRQLDRQSSRIVGREDTMHGDLRGLVAIDATFVIGSATAYPTGIGIGACTEMTSPSMWSTKTTPRAGTTIKTTEKLDVGESGESKESRMNPLRETPTSRWPVETPQGEDRIGASPFLGKQSASPFVTSSSMSNRLHAGLAEGLKNTWPSTCHPIWLGNPATKPSR
jgi:hypothetical protein